MTKINNIKQQYERYNRKKVITGLMIAGIGLVIICYSLYTGPIHLSSWEILKALVGGGDKVQRLVLWNIRLPRVLAAIIAGNPYIITLFAFGGAFAGIMVILTLAKVSRLSAYAMVLAGVAMGFLFTAATMLL